MKKKELEVAADAADASPNTETMESNSLFTRREMLGMTGMAGLAGLAGMASLTALTGTASGEVLQNPASAAPQTAQKRPRIACLVSYWGLPTSHADWIVNKLLDGYWWKGAHTPSQVDVVSVYINQLDTSLLGQKVCKAKNIPIFKTVGEAVTLGGNELAVDGVVIVCEHGNYPTDLKGHWLLPRWWIYQQVIHVFEQSKRSVPIFNDKHLSYNWDDAKWMFDKSRELDFPLTGGSSIPIYYRKPEIDFAPDTPLKNGLVIGDMADEGASFHCIDVLQSFMDRRKGGETGVKSVQSIRGPEVWKWVEANSWANNLMEAVRKDFDLPQGYFQQAGQQVTRPGAKSRGPRQPNVCIVEYNDGTKAASISGHGVGWTFAGEIEGQKDPTIISMLDWPGPVSQYHAANAHEHWLIEMMLTRKEPFNAERLLVATGIVNHYMDSNWQDGRYSAVGRVVETPYMDMKYQSTHGPLFNTGQRPPNTPFIRGFATV
jgi:hypothetical protein